MRALVTGSSGFIGRHMSHTLQSAGYDVTGVDILSHHDARDFFRRSSGRYDVVIHAAAVIGGREMIDKNPLAQAVNFELDAALFRWARLTRPGRVVYISSSAVYPVALQGLRDHRKLSECDVDLARPELPDALYGWAKLTGERLVMTARSDGIPVTVIRPFSGYGGDQSLAYPFPSFILRAREHRDPFCIWGSGEQVRDWVHVSDICAVIMIMIRDRMDGPVNIGTGRATAMTELASMAARAAGYSPEVTVMSGKPMGVAYRVADVSLMREFYTPVITLEEGVRRALTMGE